MWGDLFELLGAAADLASLSTRTEARRHRQWPRGWPWALAVFGVSVAGFGLCLAAWPHGPIRVGLWLIGISTVGVVVAVGVDRRAGRRL